VPKLSAIPDFIIGIDPGLSGAVAIYDTAEPHKSRFFDIPTIHIKGSKKVVDARKLADLVGELLFRLPTRPDGEVSTIMAVVENVHSMPRQAGAFAFGLSTGIIHGVLATHGIPFTLVTPAQWKGAMKLHRKPEEPTSAVKNRARALATRLFPHLASEFARVKDDGRAEALLLAVYAAASSPSK